MPVSVLILTLNEEINIEKCIDSVRWSNDIVVLDSLSTDCTKLIARARGAKVVERRFDSWANHQNWALENIEFKHPWVFYIDADERCTPELSKEILSRVSSDDQYDAYRVKRKDFFMGKWLKRAQLYPTWLVRVFKPDKIKFQRLVNPVPVVEGQIGNLENDLIHFPFSHGVRHWIDRHNNYSDLEAREAYKLIERRNTSFSGLTSSDPNQRRLALKNLFYKIPLRPFVKFLFYYILRRGFLDGRAGLTYSILQSFYEYMIVLKTREIIRQNQDLPL